MKKNLVSKDSDISINRQLSLVSISKGGFYYVRKGESVENLEMMRLMDQHITEDPTSGVLTMQAMLEENGYKAGYKPPYSLISCLIPSTLQANLQQRRTNIRIVLKIANNC